MGDESQNRTFAERTWEEIDALDRGKLVCLLPAAATEAHGPHLPLSTDVIIAEAMCNAAAHRLDAAGTPALVLPPLAYSHAGFATGFAGTISIQPETLTALIVDIAHSLASHDIGTLAIGNAHFEPGHVKGIYQAVQAIEEENLLRIVFPDLTRRKWAERLTDEFKSGACHAGQYEGSIVAATQPNLVREDIATNLADHPVSLVQAMKDGHTTFEDAGIPKAYVGFPSKATAEEGRETIDTLASILVEAIQTS